MAAYTEASEKRGSERHTDLKTSFSFHFFFTEWLGWLRHVKTEEDVEGMCAWVECVFKKKNCVCVMLRASLSEDTRFEWYIKEPKGLAGGMQKKNGKGKVGGKTLVVDMCVRTCVCKKYSSTSWFQKHGPSTIESLESCWNSLAVWALSYPLICLGIHVSWGHYVSCPSSPPQKIGYGPRSLLASGYLTCLPT